MWNGCLILAMAVKHQCLPVHPPSSRYLLPTVILRYALTLNYHHLHYRPSPLFFSRFQGRLSIHLQNDGLKAACTAARGKHFYVSGNVRGALQQ